MPVPQKRRRDMDPEELKLARKRGKEIRCLREQGRSVIIRPDEAEVAREHVRGLHRKGMSYAEMSAQTGAVVRRHTFADLASGRRQRVGRDRYELIMSVVFAPSDAPDRTRRGSYIDPIGTGRRIHALRGLGFPEKFLADWMGCEPQNIRYIRLNTNGIHLATKLKVAEMYEELKDRKPEEFGITGMVLTRMMTYARKHAFAPPSCWDPDTIDNPDAIPDWTGACGTRRGREIHDREGIPICSPCKKAKVYKPDVELERYEFDGGRLIYLMSRAEVSRDTLSTALGVHRDTVAAWRYETRQPDLDRLEKVAEYFGVHVSELKK